MTENTPRVPISDEVLNHIIEHDYDGQGKSKMQEVNDTMGMMVIVSIMVAIWGIVGLAIWVIHG